MQANSEAIHSMTDPRNDALRTLAVAEPWGALVIGAILGAATFLLCALLFGAKTAIAIAAVAMIVALVRRVTVAVIAFAAAAALSAAWLVTSTAALVAASTVFGIALALYARAWMRQRLAIADASLATA